MAGHSKWANIKRRKGTQDAKKTRIYNKILKEIAVAAQSGDENNPRLKLAIQNARAANMPKDNINRALQKAKVDKDKNYKEMHYEGYGPGGIAILVVALTDNFNRTASNVRHLFTKYGGSLGKQGAIKHLFDHQASFLLETSHLSEALEMECIEAGAQDIQATPEGITLYTSFQNYGAMHKALEEKALPIKSSSIAYIPHQTLTLAEPLHLKTQKLIDALEEDDDVQDVYHNLESQKMPTS